MPTALTTEQIEMPIPAPFFAHAVRTLKLDVLYRVYPSPTGVRFIKVGGEGGLARGIAGGLQSQGLLGALVAAPLLKRAAARLETLAREYDAEDPRALATAHAGSFVAAPSDFLTSALDDERTFGGNGPQYGVWNAELRNGEKLKLQFESLADMRAAFESLPQAFGSNLTVNVTWNPTKGSFERRQSGAV